MIKYLIVTNYITPLLQILNFSSIQITFKDLNQNTLDDRSFLMQMNVCFSIIWEHIPSD